MYEQYNMTVQDVIELLDKYSIKTTSCIENYQKLDLATKTDKECKKICEKRFLNKKRSPYEIYTQTWLKERNYTITDVLNALDKYIEDQKSNDINLLELYDEFTYSSGINGEYFVSEDEYYQNDYEM